MTRTFLYLIAAAFFGWLLSLLHIPAGWLIGSLMFGVFFRLNISELSMPSYLFPFSLSLIGTSIGLTMQTSMFKEVASYFLPLLVSLVAIMLGAWLLSRILTRYSNLDRTTALFSCIPGGASAMLALSEEYEADQRIVAAFQMTRAMFIALSIPVLAGLVAHWSGSGGEQAAAHTADTARTTNGTMLFPGFKIVCMLGIIALALFLAKKAKIPAGQLLYAMLLAFLINQFLFPIGSLPSIIVGIAQALLGAIIGLRFDRTTLVQLKEIGWLSLGILMMYLVLTFVISLLFFVSTPLNYVTSMLSMAPGGAPQMSSTAAVLNLDASIVASLQLIRLLTIYLLLPLVIPYVIKQPVLRKKKME
ncbi:AbrB family transcriptional regulator [Halobacillus salinarum]|uniref:AbrB family transcriptional regulator n=1 Tax=Halobacillus salinarum TaxID=2932257 RepID=A0ABY4EN79_9BACI|nr:AbrB family transcriptional regulator [Halobacillus salinarum]UOQ45910.1 AbrB family transcriptional regulator [Halobacillus salinarum]